VIRLREGEASILGGILEKQDLVSSSGIPGLGELPLLKYIFGSRSHEVIDDEIVFLLIPHVVRGQDITPLNLRTIDTGAGTAIELRRISATETKPVQPRPTAAPVNPPARPPRPQIGSVGPITGQTAEAAAPSALAQLRQSNEPSLDPAIARPLAPPAPAGGVPPRLSLVPPVGPQAVGATFQVPVALSGANDIASVPLQIQYDPGKLKLINVDSGDLLGKDGQAVALVHRDDGPGMITIAASRPPGVAGVSGSGTVCTLTFQAAVAGESDLVITRPGALDSAQRMVAATAINAHIIVK